MKRNPFFLVGCLCLFGMGLANADTVTGNQNVTGNHLQNGSLTINYYSSSDIGNIVADYAKQHQLDSEQIKALTATITDLNQGKGVSGSEAQIKAAMAALTHGNTALARDLFEKETQRGEQQAQQTAKAYRNLGALAFADNTQAALHNYRRATQLDPDDAGGWNQLGHLLKRVGDLDEAIAAYSKVLALGETHQDQAEIAMAYGNLGTIYYTRGELDKAVEFYQKGLAINERMGNQKGMAAKYGNLGNVYQTRGEMDKAVEFHQKALNIDESMGNQQGMAEDYGNLGNVYQTHGELDKAVEFHQKALNIDESMGNQQGMAEDYGNLGNVYQTHGELDKAVEFYQKGLNIDERMGNQQGMAAKYANLGRVHEQKGNQAEAKRYWQKSVELYRRLGSPIADKVQAWLDALH